MTKPDTLSSFIQWCHENYPANRMELIFWDHGGGSVSGYGYDEKNPQRRLHEPGRHQHRPEERRREV